MPRLKCPWCPKTVDSADLKRGTAESALAMHVSQSTDHPVESHAQALETLKTKDLTPPETGGSGPETPDQPSGGESGAGSNPLLSNPLVTDGGEPDDDGGDGDGDGGDSGNGDDGPTCPTCGGPMVEVSEGFRFSGVTQSGKSVKYKSDGEGDTYCRGCDVLVDEKGTMVMG